jgi:hypothetical protein
MISPLSERRPNAALAVSSRVGLGFRHGSTIPILLVVASRTPTRYPYKALARIIAVLMQAAKMRSGDGSPALRMNGSANSVAAHTSVARNVFRAIKGAPDEKKRWRRTPIRNGSPHDH